jgi:hypothetical protein
MDVTITDPYNLCVQLSHTEKKVLDYIALEKGHKIEKIFANLAFGAIMTESAQLKLTAEITKHEFFWEKD